MIVYRISIDTFGQDASNTLGLNCSHESPIDQVAHNYVETECDGQFDPRALEGEGELGEHEELEGQCSGYHDADEDSDERTGDHHRERLVEKGSLDLLAREAEREEDADFLEVGPDLLGGGDNEQEGPDGEGDATDYPEEQIEHDQTVIRVSQQLFEVHDAQALRLHQVPQIILQSFSLPCRTPPQLYLHHVFRDQKMASSVQTLHLLINLGLIFFGKQTQDGVSELGVVVLGDENSETKRGGGEFTIGKTRELTSHVDNLSFESGVQHTDVEVLTSSKGKDVAYSFGNDDRDGRGEGGEGAGVREDALGVSGGVGGRRGAEETSHAFGGGGLARNVEFRGVQGV